MNKNKLRIIEIDHLYPGHEIENDSEMFNWLSVTFVTEEWGIFSFSSDFL